MNGTGKTVGVLIQQLREQAGLSMTDLAEASGLDKASISRIERGEFIKPKEETLSAIATALGTNPADLYNAAGYTSPSALPSFRPYLRTKYGHLPADKLTELEAIFQEISQGDSENQDKDKN